MLKVKGRPEWRVVSGGSSSYIDAMRSRWKVLVRTQSKVLRVTREPNRVRVVTSVGDDYFDHVVMACHSDHALVLLGDATELEREVLGAIPYQTNEVVLHTDKRMLPANRKAWAAWNAHVSGKEGAACTVSYCMNILQSLESPVPFVVSLNRTADIDPNKILAKMRYRHPVYTHASVKAQNRRAAINGLRRTWFAGAYWRYGFHEDGLRSGVSVAHGLGVEW
jgi:predicted NAD/FAD-binding protein